MGIGPFMKMDARVKPHGHQLTPGVSRASEASALARAERDTDLGFTRDRHSKARKSGKPDLRGPSARLAKRIIGKARQLCSKSVICEATIDLPCTELVGTPTARLVPLKGTIE